MRSIVNWKGGNGSAELTFSEMKTILGRPTVTRNLFFHDGVTELSSFMSMRRDYVSELRPPTSLLFIPHVIHEYGEPRWNDIERVKSRNSKKNLSQCHFAHHKFHMG
jgi:hypothetical protein